MRVQILAAAATFALAGWSIPASGQTAADSTSSGQTAAADKDVKTEKGSDTSAWNVRHALAESTEDAVSKNGFDNLVGRLSDPDRERIKQGGDINKDQPDLQAKADAFNKAWKDKYGHDFKVRDNKDVFADATIQKGEMGNTPGLASDVKKNSETAVGTSDSKQDTDKGRDVAVVSLPAIDGAPALKVPLVNEHLMAWKINAPDSLTYQKLHDNLLKHIDMISDSSKWPADEKQASRVVAYHILMAVLDTDETGQAPTAQPAGAREPASPTPPNTATPIPETATQNRE